MKNHLYKKIFLLTILFISFYSFSCECTLYPIVNGKSLAKLKLEDSFEIATIIFFGNYIGEGKFELIKVFRGNDILSNQNLISEKEEKYNCDYSFKKNNKYLVFGKIDEEGKLWTSICVSNKQIDHESELEFVKKYLKK